jgi:hypothetical protein
MKNGFSPTQRQGSLVGKKGVNCVSEKLKPITNVSLPELQKFGTRQKKGNLDPWENPEKGRYFTKFINTFWDSMR